MYIKIKKKKDISVPEEKNKVMISLRKFENNIQPFLFQLGCIVVHQTIQMLLVSHSRKLSAVKEILKICCFANKFIWRHKDIYIYYQPFARPQYPLNPNVLNWSRRTKEIYMCYYFYYYWIPLWMVFCRSETILMQFKWTNVIW